MVQVRGGLLGSGSGSGSGSGTPEHQHLLEPRELAQHGWISSVTVGCTCIARWITV